MKFHYLTTGKIDWEKTTALTAKILADLDKIEHWSDQLDLLKRGTMIAVVNAMLTETRDGFNLPNLCQVHLRLPDEKPLLVEVTEELQQADLIDFLGQTARNHEAQAVTYAYVDVSEHINVLVLLPRCLYQISGRIEGTTFIRTSIEEVWS